MRFFIKILTLSILVQLILCLDCPYNWARGQDYDGKQWCKMPNNYGRGSGYPWKFGDGFNLDAARRRCENDNRDLGCEQWGAVIYPKCQPGYANSLCCICVPQCPSGWDRVDSGSAIYCTKQIFF